MQACVPSSSALVTNPVRSALGRVLGLSCWNFSLVSYDLLSRVPHHTCSRQQPRLTCGGCCVCCPGPDVFFTPCLSGKLMRSQLVVCRCLLCLILFSTAAASACCGGSLLCGVGEESVFNSYCLTRTFGTRADIPLVCQFGTNRA